jgi:hypothetical protein
MTDADTFAEIRHQIELWCGYPVLDEVWRHFDDLRIYVAGGAVRNALLGITAVPKDFDFFLQGASITSVIEAFRSNGRLMTTPFGSPRWYPRGNAIQYADLIPIEDFAPGLWPCENIVDVLDQFDFTANAVAFDLRTGEMFDPQNGVRDAKRRVMKMVRFDYPYGPYVPAASLDRNAVLWFRIVHYASVFKLTFEPLTRTWVREHQNYKRHSEEFTQQFFMPDLRSLRDLND